MSIKNVGNAEHYVWGVECDGWRLASNPDLAVIQERVPPGRGEPKHYHVRSRQLFFILHGRLQIELNGETYVMGEGDSLEIPPTLPHCVQNPFEQDASFLVVSTPSTTGDRVYLETTPGQSA